MKSGGWTYSNNRWRKNINGTTRTLNLRIAVNKNDEARIKVAELIKEQLKEIGIDIIVDKISDGQYGKYIEEKNYQILFTGVYTSYSPDLTYYFAQGNIENYSNNEMIELIRNASMLRDEEKIKETYKKIYNIYKEDVPFIGLYRDKNITISRDSLIGEIIPSNYTTFYGIEEWYRK